MRKKTHVHTCAAIGDPVVLHGDRGGVPANGDGGGCGRCDLQVSGSIRDWRGLKHDEDSAEECQ